MPGRVSEDWAGLAYVDQRGGPFIEEDHAAKGLVGLDFDHQYLFAQNGIVSVYRKEPNVRARQDYLLAPEVDERLLGHRLDGAARIPLRDRYLARWGRESQQASIEAMLLPREVMRIDLTEGSGCDAACSATFACCPASPAED